MLSGGTGVHRIVIDKGTEYVPNLAGLNVNLTSGGGKSHMMSKGILGLFAAATLAVGLSSAAMAELGPIEARQACMKANGAMMKVMVPIIKGQAAFDKAAIDKALADERAACEGWLTWFGDDTKPGGAVKTEAKLEIWTDRAGFEAANASFLKARDAVAAATDDASFKAALPEMGKNCQSCHETYRAAK
jgi:cytochrome c556